MVEPPERKGAGMGAWGGGSFENDDALDFASEIDSVQDLVDALVLRTPDDAIDARVACRIIVVCECVAAMRGHWHPDFPAELAARVAGFGRPSKSLYHHACDHYAAVMTRGELIELWAESGSRDFNVAMHDLLDRLNRPPQSAPKPKKKPVYNASPCAFCNQPMGEEEFSQFSITLDHGTGHPMGRGGWCHHRCLNAALHPAHMIRVYAIDPGLSLDEVDALLEQPPSASDD
jgi:hypothetical protein